MRMLFSFSFLFFFFLSNTPCPSLLSPLPLFLSLPQGIGTKTRKRKITQFYGFGDSDAKLSYGKREKKKDCPKRWNRHLQMGQRKKEINILFSSLFSLLLLPFFPPSSLLSLSSPSLLFFEQINMFMGL